MNFKLLENKIMKTKFLLVLALCSILFVSCNERSNEVINVPEVKTSIFGTIYNQNHDGIHYAQISTFPATTSLVCDYYGDYVIKDPPEGEYTVYVKADGYYSDSMKVYVTKSKDTEASIILKTK